MQNNCTYSETILNIRKKLLEQNIPQRRIAKDLNVSDAFISMLLRGKRRSCRFNIWVKENLGVTVTK
ncbi:MAG: helix-turn-helix domain-containing protein [Candidatus Moranbacteria bacterium]|nr:helix-turn-helix domain-containing protein [Candidatus Moranbacteria bacterium]